MFEFRGQGWIGNDKAAFSPNADGGLGAERSLVAHLLSRGHAELVGCCGVAAPADKARGGSVTRHPARQSGCAGYGRVSGKIDIVHAAQKAGPGELTG